MDITDTAKTLAQLGISDGYEKHAISDQPKCYLFVKKDPHGFGNDQSFDFIAIEWAAGFTNGEDINKDLYEVLFYGEAAFDGVRHLYFGSEKTDNYGYFKYPNLPTLMAALSKLSELEDQLDYVKSENEELTERKAFVTN
jgi:hypothetical protein